MKTTIVFSTIILVISSCAVAPKLHEIPALDSIELHENPKVGDYAILEDKKQGFKTTLEN